MKIAFDAIHVADSNLGVCPSMETRTRVKFFVFSERCPNRVVRRQPLVFAILVQGQDNLAVELSF